MAPFEKMRVCGGCLVLLTVVCLGSPSLSRAADAVPGELMQCSAIDDAAARLACYDRISDRPKTAAAGQSEPEVPVEAVAPPQSETPRVPVETAVPATMATSSAQKADDGSIRARVIRCENNISEQVVFYLDNGQVWKQSSHKRLKFRDCDFDATIRNEFLGFKMQPDGDKRRVRVTRVK